MPASPGVTPLTYDSWLTTVATLAVIDLQGSPGSLSTVSPEFNALIPQCLNYAELRIQRDLDLFALQENNETYTLTTGNDVISISNNDFVTIQTIAAIPPSSTKRIHLLPTTKEALRWIYDDTSYTGPPKYFAPLGGDPTTAGNTSMNFLIGPRPDANYTLSIYGTLRMPSLAAHAGGTDEATATTFISTWLPDLLVMASMVFMTGYQRNWSATSDDPQMAVNYEKQYQTLLKGAFVEEARKRFQARDWTSRAPAPVAEPAGAGG